MNKQQLGLLGVLGLLVVLLLGLGLLSSTVMEVKAGEVKKEICDDGKDNDDDKLIDCKDPDCECDEGEACSPGFWKNHTELWIGICCEGEQCGDILADLQARGPGSSAVRAAAADYLEECLGRPCNE
jgi:hypothetical protein